MLLFSLTFHESERSTISLRLWKPATSRLQQLRLSQQAKGSDSSPLLSIWEADTWGTGSHSGPLNKRPKSINCIKFSWGLPWLSGLVHSSCAAGEAELNQPAWRREKRGGSYSSLYQSSGDYRENRARLFSEGLLERNRSSSIRLYN